MEKNKVGQVAYAQPLQVLSTAANGTCVSRSFSTSFTFVIEGDAFGASASRRRVGGGGAVQPSADGGDGLAFALVPNLETRGLKGLHMGYGVPHGEAEHGSMAIEFDTHRSKEVQDPNDNHVGLNLNRTMESVATADVSPITQLSDGQLKYAWVRYDGTEGVIRVFVNDWPSRPLLPVLEVSLELCFVLSQPSVFASFCAANGGRGREAHVVKSWQWEFDDGQPLGPSLGAQPRDEPWSVLEANRAGEGSGALEAGKQYQPDGGWWEDLHSLEEGRACGEGGAPLHSANFIPPAGSDPPPRFVAIGQLVEQLTKVKHHLAEFLALAKTLNRTFVLPSCGGGHCGVFPAARLPACTHFDTDLMAQYVPWVTEAYLEEVYLKEYGRAPTVLVVDVIFSWQTCERCLRNKIMSGCETLETLPPDFVRRVNKSIPARGMLQGTPTPYRCITELDKGHQLEKVVEWARPADVLVMNKQSWAGAFDGEIDGEKKKARQHLRLAPSLFQASEQMARERLGGGRYLALYWRMEKSYVGHTDPQRRRDCATGLVESAKRVMVANQLTAVFLAADISRHPNGTWMVKSDTIPMEMTAADIREAMALLQEVRAALAPVTWDDAHAQFSSLDTGIQSLLDKVQCAMATVFVYAPPECYHANATARSQPSTYLLDIWNIRKSLKKATETRGPWKTIHSPSAMNDPYVPNT